MFSLIVNDSNSFRSFLRLLDSEYVDVYLDDHRASIVMSNNELLVCYDFEVMRSENQDNLVIRIPRKILLDFSINGKINIECICGRVKVIFNSDSGKTVCTANFAEQLIYFDSYKERLNVFNKINQRNSFLLTSLESLYKIGKVAGSVISVDSGYACVFLSHNARVYKEFSYPYPFSISSSNLQALHSAANEVYDVANYLCAIGPNYRVLATKSRCYSNREFIELKKDKEAFKRSFMGYLDFSSIWNFCNKCHPKCETMEINLINQNCCMEMGNVKYIIPVTLSDVKRSEKSTFNSLVLPLSIIKEVISQMNTKEFFVEKTKNFISMSYKDYNILF